MTSPHPLVDRLRDMHASAAESCDPEFNRALLESADTIDSLSALLAKAETALEETETVMMIVQPRSHKAEYITALRTTTATLAEIRAGRKASL